MKKILKNIKKVCARIGCYNIFIPKVHNQKYCSPLCNYLVSIESKIKAYKINKLKDKVK